MQKTDSYREHIEAKRAQREAETAARTMLREQIDHGLRLAADEAGLPELPAELIPAMRQVVMHTADLSVGQVLVLGVYLMTAAGEIIEARAAEAETAPTEG